MKLHFKRMMSEMRPGKMFAFAHFFAVGQQDANGIMATTLAYGYRMSNIERSAQHCGDELLAIRDWGGDGLRVRSKPGGGEDVAFDLRFVAASRDLYAVE